VEQDFQLFPEAASTIAGRVDLLYGFLVAVALFFTVLICVLILGFGIHYRRGSRAERKNPPQSILLEVGWAAIPLVFAMVMFAWGGTIYYEMRTPPPGTLDIEVVGKQWMWKVQHPDGRAEINELHVPLGQPVRLRMISEDVIHSFYIPVFRLKQDVLPGYYTTMWFEANRTGEFHLFCAEYCGTEHSLMRGTVTVMEPGAYANWLAGETGDPPSVVGERLFERSRCGNCHKPDGSGVAPSLVGLYGNTVTLTGGRTVIADEQYLRDSILNPAKHVVAGRQPLMPTFQGQLTEADVMKLIAYLKTLSDGEPTGSVPPN
jgi:cytochrome c oxidase subunit 2